MAALMTVMWWSWARIRTRVRWWWRPMPMWCPADDGAELRQFLRDAAIRFPDRCGLTLQMWAELSKPIDQLSAGQAYRSFRQQAGVTQKRYAKQLSESPDLLA